MTMANGTEMPTATALDRLLKELGACGDARRWARGRTLAAAWEECRRADRMLWLARRMAGDPGWPTVREAVLAAAACAETALPFAGPGRPVCEDALATARRWARGEATQEELRAASDAAAHAAHAAYAAAEGAANAAGAPANAAYAYANAAYAYANAAYAAAAAADAAAYANAAYAAAYAAANAAAYANAAYGAADAAAALVAQEANKANARMADMCRRMLRVPEE
jgi:hypothetical protein